VAGGVNFSAGLLSTGSLSGLMAVLPSGQSVLSAWNFTTNLTGGQALLGFDVGPGQPDLSVWHYDGTAWVAFAAPDLTYGDDGIADFAVTGFGAYALSILSPHDGDANNDGLVSVIDLGVLARNYDAPSGATWSTGDFNGDGAVNVVDLGVLAKNYDWVGAPGGAVPEPGSVALMLTAGLALIARKSRYAK
jgi:hypothetical protein